MKVNKDFLFGCSTGLWYACCALLPGTLVLLW